MPTMPQDAMEETPTPTPESFVPEAEQPQSAPPGRDKMFEDFFPSLDLTDAAKEDIATWLIRDLKACVQNVDSIRNQWALHRAVYALEYVEKFYPSMGLGANFTSGLLFERVVEGIDRLRLGLFAPQPWFCVNEKISNVSEIEFIHRAEWFMQTILENDLDLRDVIGTDGLFEFILDGSLILEADTMYEKVPQRVIRTYLTAEKLAEDQDKCLDDADYIAAQQAIADGRPARMLVEADVVTKNGMQFFKVDKIDHLIPPNVLEDRDIKFRARRMYLTENDLMLLSSKGVGWYERKDIEEVLNKRTMRRLNRSLSQSGVSTGEDAAKDEVSLQNVWDLCYDWQSESDSLGGDVKNAPYKNTFAVYRVLCKYGYRTKSDPKGLIPKYVMIDIEPESRKILRAKTYPHFTEAPCYFHFKMGVKPKSYWGFGFGARLINEDFLESNAVDLTLDSAAMATFRPLLSVHPDDGGYVPFKDGIGPFKIGYVKTINDVKALEIPPPSPMLLNVLLPLTQQRAANRTSITSLMQGNTDSTDPRSPAAKTGMLLQQANIGIEGMIDDWNRSWERLADWVWQGCYEMAVYNEDIELVNKIIFPGTQPELEKTNRITLEELAKPLKWKSQAASQYINAQVREETFMKQLQFFTPMLQGIAQFNPELYKKYFFRWMRLAAQVMDIRGFRYLIPSEAEMVAMNPEQMQGMTQNMMTSLRSGQAPEVMPDQGQGGEQAQPNPEAQQEAETLQQVMGGEG